MTVAFRRFEKLRRAPIERTLRYASHNVRCPSWQPVTCRWSSSDASVANSKEKPYYVTTPIFYVNAAPHIGHLHNMVLTDVLKRWEQIKGGKAFMLTGTDEHGMKIQRAAAKLSVPPLEFCDSNSDKFRKLAADANISNDHFIRTTDADHKEAVGHFWKQLRHSLPSDLGLYKSTHAGWYCVSDECFYPEDQVELMIEPQTGKKTMISMETENEVEWVEEETWFFPLSKYKDALLKFYDENPDWITPASRMNEIREWVTNNLEDLSVTRPASRLSWGIPDPENPEHTIYVWVDALVNYLTTTGYGKSWTSSEQDTGMWPADLHVIGKDILRFHAVYWPALLLALGLPLPKKILCHNHWTMSNRKMSKSRGNVVDPVLAMQRWEVDPLRYFLMNHNNLERDMSYSNEFVSADYDKHLRANIGNLYYRVANCGSKDPWSTLQSVQAYRDGKFEATELATKLQEHDFKHQSLNEHLEAAPRVFAREMGNLNPAGAARATFDLLRQTNRYIAAIEPWHMPSDADPLTRTLRDYTIFNAAEAIRIAAILLQPIMPERMTRLLDEMNVAPEHRTLEYAQRGKDSSYGVPTRTQQGLGRIDKFDSLFPPNYHSQETETSGEEAHMLRAMYRGKGTPLRRKTDMLGLEAEVGEEEARARMKNSV